MNVLILSANTGQGHNSCAAALQEYFCRRESSCEICDSLAFMSEGVSKFVCGLHVGVYRKAPGAFAWGYGVSENHPGIFGQKSPLYLFFKKGAKRLAEYMEGRKYDIVIACHVFAAVMLTAARKMSPQAFKTAFVATDYTCSPGVDQSDLDFYFIPDASLKDEFVRGCVSASRIFASGIPVRGNFPEHTGKKEAKRSVGVDENHAHLLVMCGSMGCGPIAEIAAELEKHLESGQEASIVCGTNAKLQNRLEKQFAAHERIHILGYVKDMALLMDSADLYLTKPGGLSSTEAAYKRLPMVFVNAVSGCEGYNCSFFTQRGGAVCEDTPKALAGRCVSLLKDEETLEKMRRALAETFFENAAENIYNILIK